MRIFSQSPVPNNPAIERQVPEQYVWCRGKFRPMIPIAGSLGESDLQGHAASVNEELGTSRFNCVGLQLRSVPNDAHISRSFAWSCHAPAKDATVEAMALSHQEWMKQVTFKANYRFALITTYESVDVAVTRGARLLPSLRRRACLSNVASQFGGLLSGHLPCTIRLGPL